ncbi:hypothetical protein BDD43_5165 [Mucilaginibacter gracilis]|uniref:Uncharacterized protein n=1 Tax=Mucilaginibacter gracilis TaxID=423350 RepID=A0A495J948_9SPHI|nr:hypothetical protein [Mucilaginibacter gracilis]RKR84912.1 hypothetical protein BDD43_5165 [Mucilaginibacter gracilis]
MPNKKISELPEDLVVTIADYVPITTSGSAVTKKVRVSNLLSLVATSGAAPHFVGKYVSLEALQLNIPVGVDGDYAVIADSPHAQEYIWDSNLNNWVLSNNEPASTFALLSGNATDNGSLLSELTARDTAIANKVDKVDGKGLSTEDYTTAEKTKLAALTGSFAGLTGNPADNAALNSALTGETAERLSADAGLQSQVTNLNASLATEVTDRQTADTALQSQVTTLNSNLNTETANRVSGDATLQDEVTTLGSSLTTETTNRVNGDAALQDEVSTLGSSLTTETTNRVNGDAALQSQVSALSAALVPHPTYTAPSASLSSTQTTSGLEIGQSISIPLTATFTQNDGGSSTALSIKKNGTQISTTSPYTDATVVMSATAVAYTATFSYAQGPIKNNIIGIADATGRIPASNATSSTLSYQGFYKLWYDTVTAFPTDSASARALTNARLSNAGNTFTLNTGSTNTKFCLVLPPGKSLVSVIDQDALNLDITAQYVQSAITVNDASGTPVTTYKIYAMSQSIPYSTTHRHNITIA